MYFLPKYRRGILNRYHRKMPLSERITKDIGEATLYLIRALRHGFRSRTILCHPHFPSRGSTFYKMAHYLGYNVTNLPSRRHELAVYWEYGTYREEYALLEQLAGAKRVLNLHNRDISKRHVDAVHQEIFGYNTSVDPLRHEGPAVEKSDLNAIKNYRVVQCPLEAAQEGAFYQVLIDNQVDDKSVEDIRLAIVGGTLATAWLKYRRLDNRFTSTFYTRAVPINEVLSETEIRKVNAFAQAMHLELGELDALRNRADQKLYVIDVNNTPIGPPPGFSKAEGRAFIAEQAEAFARRYLNF